MCLNIYFFFMFEMKSFIKNRKKYYFIISSELFLEYFICHSYKNINLIFTLLFNCLFNHYSSLWLSYPFPFASSKVLNDCFEKRIIYFTLKIKNLIYMWNHLLIRISVHLLPWVIKIIWCQIKWLHIFLSMRYQWPVNIIDIIIPFFLF